MKTISDRNEFQQTLDDPSATLLLLFGESPLADKLHAKAEVIGLDPDRKVVWISKLDVLTSDEMRDWYRDDNQYATLSMPSDGNKRSVKTGLLGDLCLPSGEPSSFALRKAFTTADA